MTATFLLLALATIVHGTTMRANHTRTAFTNQKATLNHTSTISSSIMNYRWYEIFCSDNQLDLLELYYRQKSDAYFYKYICLYLFVKVYKLKRPGEVLLFGSMFYQNGTEDDFRLPAEVASINNESLVNFGIVIRFGTTLSATSNNSSNSTGVEISVGSQKFKLRLSNGQFEYALPATFQYPINSNSGVSFPPDVFPHILDSYTMVCVNVNHSDLICDIRIRGINVECYCPTNQLGYVIVLIFFIFALPILLLLLNCSCPKSSEPEVQLNLILCVAALAKYEYLIVFRVGPATDGFDYNSGHIDFQLMTDENESVGAPVRFSTDKLTDPICSELHMYVMTISPLPLITALQVSHSSANALLFLYDFIVINLHEDNSIKQIELLNSFITPEPGIIRVKAAPQVNGNPAEASTTRSTNDATVDQLADWMPISLIQLTSWERLAFGALILGLDSLAVMVARLHLKYFAYWNDGSQFWEQFIYCLLITALLSWLLLGLIEWSYTLCVKKYYIIEEFEQVTSTSAFSPFWWLRLLWLIMMSTVGTAFYLYTIVLSFQLDLISAWIWSGVTLCILVSTISTWHLVDEFIFAYLRASRANYSYHCKASDSGPGTSSTVLQHIASTSYSGHVARLSRFSHPLSKSTIKSCSFGPKLYNPHLIKCSKSSIKQKSSLLAG